ncbi:hypothetical protein FQZ97_973920 [compost metagenome]
MLQVLLACRTQVSMSASRPGLERLRATQSSGLPCTKQPSTRVSSGVSKPSATAQVGSMATLAATPASLGAEASNAVACGAGVATMTWLKGPWLRPSASCRPQWRSPRKTSVIRQAKFTGRAPSMARVIALMRGVPTQRICSSGEGCRRPSLKW